jgi:hypothetical protein
MSWIFVVLGLLFYTSSKTLNPVEGFLKKEYNAEAVFTRKTWNLSFKTTPSSWSDWKCCILLERRCALTTHIGIKNDKIKDVFLYSPQTLLCIDLTGTDCCDVLRKGGYSIRGQPAVKQCTLTGCDSNCSNVSRLHCSTRNSQRWCWWWSLV